VEADKVIWKPMSEALKRGSVYARDADGAEAWTWHDGYEWVRECWREDADQDERLSEEWWTPVEFAEAREARKDGGS
jgi:hypothetical protein